MGQWVIVIEGTGCHHNKDNPTDADRMAKRFVDELTRVGHSVTNATFTHGAAEGLQGERKPEP